MLRFVLLLLWRAILLVVSGGFCVRGIAASIWIINVNASFVKMNISRYRRWILHAVDIHVPLAQISLSAAPCCLLDSAINNQHTLSHCLPDRYGVVEAAEP